MRSSLLFLLTIFYERKEAVKKNCVLSASVFIVLSFFATVPCHAVMPFGNVANPEGFYFTDYPTFYTADKMKDRDGDTVNDDLELESYTNLFRFTYYNKSMFDNTWAWSAIIPVTRNEVLGFHDQGVGDFVLAASYWLIDDPVNKTWLAPMMFVHVPFGDDDPGNPASVGLNVWKFEPTLTFAKFIGKFDIEGTLKYRIYTENDDTGKKKGNEVRLESYAGYFLKPNMLLGMHFNAVWGDNDKLNGVEVSDSATRKFQAGPGFSWRPTDRSLGPAIPGVTAMYLTEFECKNATEGHLFQLRLTWKF